jgi:hypothetical protein
VFCGLGVNRSWNSRGQLSHNVDQLSPADQRTSKVSIKLVHMALQSVYHQPSKLDFLNKPSVNKLERPGLLSKGLSGEFLGDTREIRRR